MFNEPAFLDRLRRGEEGAYRKLIRRFHGSLVGVAAGIVGSRAQAEEVVQDTWLAVFSSIARFEGRSSLASWLFTITLNRARTRVQREGRMVPFSSFSEGSDGDERAVDPARFIPDGHWAEKPALWDTLDPERIVGGRQLWDVVQEVIERMPAGQRAVIVMRDIESVDAEQVCALLEISAENQRVLLHRARGRVRAAIEAAISGGATAPDRVRGGGGARAGVGSGAIKQGGSSWSRAVFCWLPRCWAWFAPPARLAPSSSR